MNRWSLARILTTAAVVLAFITTVGIATVVMTTSRTTYLHNHQTAALIEDQGTADRIVRRVRRQVDIARAAGETPQNNAIFRSIGDSIRGDIVGYIGRDLPIDERILAAHIKDLHSLVEASLQRPVSSPAVNTVRRIQTDSLSDALDRLVAMRYARYTQLAATNTARTKGLLMVSSATGILILIVALVILRLVQRRIVVRLNALAHAARAVGEGNFSAQVAESQTDELAAVSQQFNAMVRQLQRGNEETAEMNRALRFSEARFRSLIENVSDAVLVIDASGRPKYQSPSVERMLGYSPETLNRSSIIDLMHEKDRDAFLAAFIQLRSKVGMTATFELRCRHADGTWRVLNLTGTNLLDDPAVGGIVLNMLDTTSHRELEKQLMHSQKMEAIGRLAGGIAHDFNNLLTAISGYVDILGEQVSPSSRGDIDEIQKAVERGARLTSQLLAFSSYRPTQSGPNNLSSVVREVEPMLRVLLGENIEYRTIIEPDVWVRPDISQLEQVLVNLVVNSRDAVGDTGWIEVRVDTVELREDETRPVGLSAGSFARLVVRDNGCGMSTDTLTHAFEPFFTTKETGRGTGLGLATLYGIVQQARGAIDVKSRESEGAEFSIYLPLERVPDTTSIVASTAPAGAGGEELLLLVEDEASVRALAHRILERKGYRVLTASNGGEAIDLARSLDVQPDLLITDVVMPGIGGRELAEHMALISPTTKVLYMSGYTADEFTYDSGSPPINFIEKPFTPAAFAQKVRSVLDESIVWMPE